MICYCGLVGRNTDRDADTPGPSGRSVWDLVQFLVGFRHTNTRIPGLSHRLWRNRKRQ